MAASAAVDLEPPWRVLSSGRCHVYVLPCREADVLKIGFARDPLHRFRALHRRWFAFFDLDRGLLIETEKVGEARQIERELKSLAAALAEPPPLSVRAAAGGRSEWFRGADPRVTDAAVAIAASTGFALHRPLSAWLREQLQSWDGGYDASLAAIERLHYLQQHGDPAMLRRHERSLRDALDAWTALDIDLSGRFPERVLDWYRDGVLR